MVQFAIYLFTKHEMYSPLIRTTLYQSESWQETDGTFKWGNWGEFNEGTIFSGVRVKGNQKGMMSIKGLQHRERWPPLKPRDQKREQSLDPESNSSCKPGHLWEPCLGRVTQPSFCNQKGKTPDLTLHAVFLFAESGTLGEEKNRESVWRGKWKLVLL